ncbi:hypothetical protein Tco_0770637 [Tanacetum coccineum]|uniref:PH domain-containing protein n=1 Tax=Tanacetum coccineum TaxID=301880 RepID=A0ABQ4ZEP8_9ASTR
MSKLLYTRFTKLIIDYLLSLNKSIPRISNFKLHSSQDDHPITKLLNMTNGDYKFGMEVLDTIISDAIKKKAEHKYYMAKKVEIANVPNKLKKDVVPRKTRSLTIAEEAVVDTDSDATLYSSSSNESENETGDADESDKDLSNDNPHRDDDDVRYGVFMHNKSTAIPNSTYLSPTITSSLLDFIQTLLDETPANELTNFMSHPVYTDAQTTLEVHNPEGNPELTSYISGASEVPLAKKLMQKKKKNMRKFNFKKAVTQKFKEYDQKLEALTNFNVSESFEKAIQAKVLTEIKKLLPTHIPNAISNYVKPRLNTSVLEVMKTNQINLFTQSSTSIDDFLEMDLKLKLSHNNQDPPNNREGENKKKRQKDVGEPFSRSSRRNRSPLVIVQDDTPAMKPLDQTDILIQKHFIPEWFPKKSGLAKRSTTWFDLFLKSDIDKDENHILGPSTIAIAKKFKELIQKDELSIADLEGAGLERLKWNSDEGDVSKPRSFERHMSKSTKPHPCFYNNDYTYLVDLSTEEKYTTSITKHYTVRYYKEGIEDKILERWTKEVCRYHFEAHNGIHHWEENIIDFFKAGTSAVIKGNIFLDLRIKSVVLIPALSLEEKLWIATLETLMVYFLIFLLAVLGRHLDLVDKLRQWDVGINTDLNLLRCSLCNTQSDSHAHFYFLSAPNSSTGLEVSASSAI